MSDLSQRNQLNANIRLLVFAQMKFTVKVKTQTFDFNRNEDQDSRLRLLGQCQLAVCDTKVTPQDIRIRGEFSGTAAHRCFPKEVAKWHICKDFLGKVQFRVQFSNGEKTSLTPQRFHELYEVK